MENKLKEDSSIYPIMSSLKLMDLFVRKIEKSVDFEAKFLAKGLRNTVIDANFSIDSSTLTKKGDITSILLKPFGL